METVRLGRWGSGGSVACWRRPPARAARPRWSSCFARSEEGRRAFAEAHGCAPAESLEALLADPAIARGHHRDAAFDARRPDRAGRRRPGSTSSSRSRSR